MYSQREAVIYRVASATAANVFVFPQKPLVTKATAAATAAATATATASAVAAAAAAAVAAVAAGNTAATVLPNALVLLALPFPKPS